MHLKREQIIAEEKIASCCLLLEIAEEKNMNLVKIFSSAITSSAIISSFKVITTRNDHTSKMSSSFSRFTFSCYVYVHSLLVTNLCK